MIAGHPDPLVRDQYLMAVADRCQVRPDRLRTMGSAPADRPVAVRRTAPSAVGGPEMEALRLLVQRPDDIAAQLHSVMFSPGVALEGYQALSGAPDVYRAIEGAAPQVAELLQRAALDESDAEPDDVVNLLLERAVDRELTTLKAEMRRASPADQAAYSPTIGWLKLAAEQIRSDESDDRSFAREASEALVGWLVARRVDAPAFEASGGQDQ